jgi:DNA polymerase III alpha subunit
MKKHIKFVGLHAHSVAGSPFDALGYPQDHMDFAYENGLDAFALTDHGNCNGLSYQVLHAKKMEKEGKNFKAIFGAEAYFHPSLKQWHLEYEKAQQDKKNKIKDEDLQGGAVVEDESETKRTIKRALNRRHHLVLLAMNPEGLTNLFTLVSKSFEDGNYYRFPPHGLRNACEAQQGVDSHECLCRRHRTNRYKLWKNRDKRSNR